MDCLPNEIVHLIYIFLSTADVRSFRLTCRAFSEIGEEVLFSDFEFRLYPRVRRLHDLSALAESAIAKRLKCISYESGILSEWQDYRLWQSAEFSRREAEFSRQNASKTILRDLYHVLRTELNSRFSPSLEEKYNQYRWWIDDQARVMSDDAITIELTNSLMKLPYIEELKLVMKEPIIRLEDLEQGDEAYREYTTVQAHIQNNETDRSCEVGNRRAYTGKHFCSLLQAALQLQKQNFPLRLKQITTVELPRELLASESLLPDPHSTDRIQGARVSSSFAPLLTHLTHLNIDISHYPHSDYLARNHPPLYTHGRDLGSLRLISLLNLSPSKTLTHLSLTLPISRKSEFSFALFDTTNLDRFPRSFLPRLTHFHLANFTCTYADFAALFSAAAAPSLTHLALHDGTLETGSLVWLLRFLATTRRPHRLAAFEISGEWPVLDDDGKWHSREEEDYGGSCLDYEGAYPKWGLRRRVQEYVVKGGGGGARGGERRRRRVGGGGGDEEDDEEEKEEIPCPLPVWGRDENARSTWDERGDASFHYHPGRVGMWSSREYNSYFGLVPADVP